MKTFLINTLIALTVLFAITACDPSENASTGTLEVVLTDAPANYDAVFIDIQEVRIHADSDAEEDESGWRTINDQPLRLNLLDLTNGTTEVLGEEELEAGTYNQMRFILGEENEIVIDGQSIPLTTPSARQSGLKLSIDAVIESGVTYTLLLDFDASRSIVEAGNSGMYLLKPVIKAVNLAETGAIQGGISPVDAQPWVYAIAEEDTLAGTQASAEGDFLLIGLTSGTYDLSVTPADEGLNPTVMPNVNVIAPDTTSVGTIELQGVE